MENTNMAFDDHVERYKNYMDRIRAICKFFDQRFSVIPVAWFWRHRFRAMALFMRGTNIATFTPGAPDFQIGSNMHNWRKQSLQRQSIVRACMLLSIETRLPITVSQVEAWIYSSEGHKNKNFEASRTQIRNTLIDGVKNGIYEEVRGSGSSGAQYALTNLATRDLTDRIFAKMIAPDMVELAKFVVAFDQMRRQSEFTYRQESQGKITATDHQSILERLYWGDAGRRDNE